jgi:hypothetical protein
VLVENVVLPVMVAAAVRIVHPVCPVAGRRAQRKCQPAGGASCALVARRAGAFGVAGSRALDKGGPAVLVPLNIKLLLFIYM